MEIAVVDDQREYHSIIRTRLKLIKKYDINISTFKSVKELDKSKQKYNLILLDIDMPDINGVDYSKKHLDQNIVFISNHSSYMKYGYGTNVYAFIEKSDSVEYFVKTIQDVLDKICSQKYINVKTEQGVRSVFEKDIIYIQYIERKTVLIKVLNGEYMVKGRGLVDFKNELSSCFVLCDRDTLININYIVGITNDNKILLKGIKNKFSVSIRRIAEVKEAYWSKFK